MAIYKKNINAYAMGSPLSRIARQPIVSGRAPSVKDRAEIGSIWVEIKGSTVSRSTYIMAGVENGVNVWKNLYSSTNHSTIASPIVQLNVTGFNNVITLTGFTTAADAKFYLTVSNPLMKKDSIVLTSVSTFTANNSGIVISKSHVDNGRVVLTLWNTAIASAINGDILVSIVIVDN